MPNSARLTVAISTIGGRAGRIILPDPDPGITYLILLQQPDRAVALPARADLTVLPLDSLGVAASRNAALARTETEYLLFGDDDVTLDPVGMHRLWAMLRADPGLDIVTGRLSGPDRGHSASRAHRLRHWNTGRTGTPEIMVRPERIRARGVRFDTDFGLGARYGLGDEFVFLTDALKAGLRGRFAPITVGHHPHPSTGSDWTDPTLLAARVAVLSRVFGPAAPVLRLIYAMKHRRRLREAPGGLARFIRGRPPGP